MGSNFRMVLISDDRYCLGLLKGYCQAHHYSIIEISASTKSIAKLSEIQADLIVLSMSFTKKSIKDSALELIKEISLHKKIPVCCLSKSGMVKQLEKNMSWVDTVLDNPLNINQMDRYLKNKFRTHERFISERRNNERRAASDRRSVTNNKQSTIHHSEPLVNNSGHNHKNSFVLGPFYIDHRAKSVLINGKVVELTRKEFDLFELLASDVERVFLADEIIDYLWPINDRATKSDLYQYMHLLRKKIEEDPNNPQWILTIKGFGYKLDVPRSAASEVQGINLTSKEK